MSLKYIDKFGHINTIQESANYTGNWHCWAQCPSGIHLLNKTSMNCCFPLPPTSFSRQIGQVVRSVTESPLS